MVVDYAAAVADDLHQRLVELADHAIVGDPAAGRLPAELAWHMASLVTLCGGLDCDTLQHLIANEAAELGHVLPAGAAPVLAALGRALPASETGEVKPIEPDLIGEAVMLKA